MIATVRGQVLSVGLDHAVVEVGGAGLAVQATPSTLGGLRVGAEARLWTSLVVREDSLTLFGFADARSRDLFTLLQTASGIGPRLAMAALAVLQPEQLCLALAEGQIAVLTQVPGIGKKGAERLSLELRDKVAGLAEELGAVHLGANAAPAGDAAQAKLRSDVAEALVGLGFSAKQAESTVDRVLADEHASGVQRPETSAVLRRALLSLGPQPKGAP